MALTIDSPPASLGTGATADAFERAVYRKVALRILPLLVFGYILNYLDRINIGIAQIQFKSDLGLSDAAYGFGAGLLFVGYVVFEIPSNLMLDLSIPLAATLGTPLSGWIMHAFQGQLGLHGWQWLFLLEGMPSAVFGVVLFFVLSDRPDSAPWLASAERAFILADLERDESHKTRRSKHAPFRAILSDPRVFCAGFTFACSFSLGNTLAFWAPMVIRNSGVAQVVNVGILAGIPAFIGTIVMLLVGRHSDRTLERRWHAAIALVCAAAALAMLPPFHGNTVVAIVLLAVASAGHYSCLSVFWSIPPTYLTRETAAGGIAVINVIGSLGGALNTAALGWMSHGAAGFGSGLVVLGAIIGCGAVVLLVAFPARTIRSAPA